MKEPSSVGSWRENEGIGEDRGERRGEGEEEAREEARDQYLRQEKNPEWVALPPSLLPPCPSTSELTTRHGGTDAILSIHFSVGAMACN